MKKLQKELIPYNHYKGIESIVSGREPTNADDATVVPQMSNSVGNQVKKKPKKKKK